MNIYARISYKYYPYLNDKAKKTHDIYRLIRRNNEMYWERVTMSSLTTDFNYMFYMDGLKKFNAAYIKFEEWHLTKLAIRYNKYKEINKEKRNEISNRPT